MIPKRKTVRVLGVDLPWDAGHHRYLGMTRLGHVEIAPLSAASNWHRASWLGVSVADNDGPQRTASAASRWLLRAEKQIRGVR